MRKQMLKRVAGFIAACVLSGGVAQAATITEFFEYGPTPSPVKDLGAAAGGWSSAWLDSDRPAYLPDKQLTYNAPGYSNAGNGQGAAGFGAGNAASKVRRGLGNPGLDGTIWVSALAQIETSAGEVLLWLGGSPSTPSDNYIAIRGGKVGFRYNGNTQTGANVAENTTHLLLARIQVNVNAEGHDTLEFWFNPDLSNGEAGLGTPTFSGSGAHIFGLDGANPVNMSAVQISFANNGLLDAIRISNDPDGFAKVTSVPEPASAMGLMGLGSLALLRRSAR